LSLVLRTIGEICDEGGGIVKTGPFGSQLHEKDYVECGIPIVMPKDILQGRVSEASIARVSEEDAERLAQHALKPGDIVYGRRGDIGRQALITDRERGWLCGTGCLRMTVGEKTSVDPLFLHFYLRETSVITWIANQAIGATMPNLNTSILRSIPVHHPPLETQKKIAAILSSYDDLIENNTRRIEILEDMARGLYREWFVNFRFPGHEEVEMVDSSLGLIPAGWKVQKVADAFEVIGGGTPSKGVEEFWQNSEINWFTPSDLTGAKTLFMDGSENKISRLGLAKSSARLFPPFCVMMTSRATIGAFAINTTEATTNQGFIVMKPNAVLPLYTLYFWARENVELFISKATGTIFKEISKGTFKTIDLVLPPAKITQAFEKIVQPLGAQVLVLQRKNANFRRTRDLLLPKLISGEIDVSTLEIAGVTGSETAIESV
jgi:type I restriction enzyme, S subunit